MLVPQSDLKPIVVSQSGLKPEDIFALIKEKIPTFKSIYDIDDGIYCILGDFAIYLKDSIDEGTISDIDLENAFEIMNMMGSTKDIELHNLLIVGVLEILTDSKKVIEVIRQGLEGEAAQFFEEAISFWK